MTKTAVVTGASRGIGRAIALKLAQDGANVVVNYSGSQAKAEEVVAEIKALGQQAIAVQANVADADEVKALMGAAMDAFGSIDILVNNAGVSSEKPYTEINKEDWDFMMAINGFGPFAGMKHIAPIMAEQGKGSIVNISSYTAQIGQGFNHYSASKGAVRAISKAAATQFGRQGVRVNALFPGIIETPMTQGLSTSKDLLNQLIQATPLQRLGQPEDIAKAALFLASDDSSYITGAEIVIDGGFSAQ